VGRAEKAGVPVIENGNIEHAIAQAMELVLERAERFEQVR
jgi:2-phosphoglycerate kinase